jgi:membrane-associated protease RseP (regulator of RpoE activity)
MESAEGFWRLQSASREGILGFFILSSLVQAVTNLMPVQSFDGGRILYCALARYVDSDTAERIVAAASALSAFVLWTVALYLMLRISSGLGIYVFAACIFAGMITEKERI